MFEMRPVYYHYEPSRAGKVRCGNGSGGRRGRGQYSAPLLRCSFLTMARKAPGVPANMNSTSVPGFAFMNSVAFSHSSSLSPVTVSKTSLNFLTLYMQKKKTNIMNRENLFDRISNYFFFMSPFQNKTCKLFVSNQLQKRTEELQTYS